MTSLDGSAELPLRDRDLRVLVADDHPAFRGGLRAALDSSPGVRVVGEAGDGLEVVRLCQLHRPDVVVMDLAMPRLGGLVATRRIVAAQPGTAVLIVTMSHDVDSVHAALSAGARGYLLKGATRAALVAAVQAVASGRLVLGAGVEQ
jgi:DNA-binding NarL/FixJ family response regulator